MRTRMVAGNWKMNKNLQEGVALATELKEAVKNPNCAVVIGTPFIHLATVAELLKGSPIKVAAENCADHERVLVYGLFTADFQFQGIGNNRFGLFRMPDLLFGLHKLPDKKHTL